MDGFEHLIVTGAAVLVGLVIGLILLYLKLVKDAENAPDEGRRLELLAQIKHMRENNATYQERLAYLKEQGLRRDVADELLGEDITKGG